MGYIIFPAQHSNMITQHFVPICVFLHCFTYLPTYLVSMYYFEENPQEHHKIKEEHRDLTFW